MDRMRAVLYGGFAFTTALLVQGAIVLYASIPTVLMLGITTGIGLLVGLMHLQTIV